MYWQCNRVQSVFDIMASVIVDQFFVHVLLYRRMQLLIHVLVYIIYIYIQESLQDGRLGETAAQYSKPSTSSRDDSQSQRLEARPQFVLMSKDDFQSEHRTHTKTLLPWTISSWLYKDANAATLLTTGHVMQSQVTHFLDNWGWWSRGLEQMNTIDQSKVFGLYLIYTTLNKQRSKKNNTART